jgi:iron complex transport system ATP-binding protein
MSERERERASDMREQLDMTPDASYELLGARDVHVSINGVQILRAINLKIGVAERVAIVGANGAGKTSLLRALSGTLPVASGEVILCTEPIKKLNRATIARSIAVVGADLALPFATRADELVALGRLPPGSGPGGPTAHDRARAAAALERVGATHLAARDVRTLSAGERQLIAIALGLAQETPILALDEPTVHLDLKHRVEIADLLVSLADRARTVVAIFHELDMVRDLFPRVIVMKGGQIVGDGAPSEVLTAARVADAWGIPVERAARL